MAEKIIVVTKLITIKQTAERLGVSRSRVYELLEDGTLPKTKVLPIRIPLESVLDYMRSIMDIAE